ncbi:hypothetical protein [Litchfieldia alkalitelluris]|uniref:hypothetical protein n=1 Tax=Litchfieldia alkalitelluris TaxID=304268 RepID=UPI000995E151|nr:hypothetical protein [Litchfieldia alkalitelluris]
MSKNKDQLTGISSKLMEVFVSDVLKKNNISKENTKKVSPEQKQKLQEVVADLQKQVDEFLAGNVNKEVSEEKIEELEQEIEPTAKRSTLRDKFKNKLNDQ